MEAPAFMRGELDFSPAERRLLPNWALASDCPALKRNSFFATFIARLESLAPPTEVGGFHPDGLRFRLKVGGSTRTVTVNYLAVIFRLEK